MELKKDPLQKFSDELDKDREVAKKKTVKRVAKPVKK